MQIDFTQTEQDGHRVNYLTADGQLVYFVTLEQIKDHVFDTRIDEIERDWERSGKRYDRKQGEPTLQDKLINDFLDDDYNWLRVTEEYHNKIAKSGFKSNNTYSQKGQILC